MSFFIDNLWSYFHLDVLDVQWSKLEDSIHNAKGKSITVIFNIKYEKIDFEDMRKVHELYLTSISNQIFLSFPVIVKAIFHVITQCRRLVNLVQRYIILYYFSNCFRADIGLGKNDTAEEYRSIKKDYDNSCSDMIAIISLLNKNQNSPYLYQLLLRLDYNNFYSKAQTI